MTTPLSLRVNFKKDTGEYPIWSNCLNKETFLMAEKSKYKYAYGLWLEDLLGNYRKLRDEYEKDCPTCLAVHKTERFPEWPTQGYMGWLEEQAINRL
jgi:hypothetical protein